MHESERRFELALAAGRLGAWEWNIETGRVIWSPSLEMIHGLKGGTFGGTFEDFKRDIHPDDLDLVLGQIRQALDTLGGYHVLYRMRRSDGSERWLETFGRVILDGTDCPLNASLDSIILYDKLECEWG